MCSPSANACTATIPPVPPDAPPPRCTRPKRARWFTTTLNASAAATACWRVRLALRPYNGTRSRPRSANARVALTVSAAATFPRLPQGGFVSAGSVGGAAGRPDLRVSGHHTHGRCRHALARLATTGASTGALRHVRSIVVRQPLRHDSRFRVPADSFRGAGSAACPATLAQVEWSMAMGASAATIFIFGYAARRLPILTNEQTAGFR